MLVFIGVCLLATFAQVLGQCCNEPTLLYEDLKCKPIFVSAQDCCPVMFDCSHIIQRNAINEEKCYFHGKTYSEGESINDNEMYGNCQYGCTCRKKRSGNMGFTCDVHECSEWFGLRPKPGCHFKYQLEECCNVGEVCPPYTTTCQVYGNTFHEGEEFNAPNAKCTKCVCQAGFTGVYEEPFCKKRQCVEEIEHQKDIKKFCAPSYLNNDHCCPFSWICPRNDNIIRARTRSRYPDLKCKFGPSTLNVGDRFTRSTDNGGYLSCECRIPPFLTCTQNSEYPSYVPDY